MIVAGGKMALTRKANPLIDAGSGLVTIAATSAVGVLLPTLLLQAGDAWSNWVLNASTGGQFGARLTSLLSMTGLAAPAVVVVLGIVAIIISALQAMLMLFRQGALVVLAGTLPLAAAGTLTPATRPWFQKVTGWMLALIFYKPAAAAVYAAAFTMIGTGKDVRTILTGFAMVLMSPAGAARSACGSSPGRPARSPTRPPAAGSCRPRCPARSRSAPCAAFPAGWAGPAPPTRPASNHSGSARPTARRAAPGQQAPGSRQSAAAPAPGASPAAGAASAGCRAGWRRCGGRPGRARGSRAGGRSTQRRPHGNRGHAASR